MTRLTKAVTFLTTWASLSSALIFFTERFEVSESPNADLFAVSASLPIAASAVYVAEMKKEERHSIRRNFGSPYQPVIPEHSERYQRKVNRILRKFRRSRVRSVSKRNVSQLQDIGWIKLRMGNVLAAEEVFQRLQQYAESAKEEENYAQASLGLGRVNLLKGEEESARNFLEKARAAFDALENKRGVAESLRWLGDIHKLRSDGSFAELSRTNEEIKLERLRHLEDARDYYSRSLTLFESIDDWYGKAMCYSALGNVSKRRSKLLGAPDDYHEAEAYYLKSMNIRETAGDRESVSFIENNLALLRINQGKYREANELAKKAVRARRDLGIDLYLGNALATLAKTELHLKHNSEARSALTELRSLVDSTGSASLERNHSGLVKALIKSELLESIDVLLE